MKYLLGIDVGTSNIKAVLFDEKGAEVGAASRENETFQEAGNCEEQDMEAVWTNMKACLKELAAV